MGISKPAQIKLGQASGYLVPAREGYVLVDAGVPGSERRFFQVLESWGIEPREVRLIVVTHVHYDHVGGLQAIKERCGAPVMVHRREAPQLETGTVVMPPGLSFLGKLMSLGGQILKRFVHVAPCKADLVVDGEADLAGFGLDGKVIPTPGHTAGSLTVLLADGKAFVGDLCFNSSRSDAASVFPLLGEDRAGIYESWRRLLAAGAKTIYPGHGAPFRAERPQAELASRR